MNRTRTVTIGLLLIALLWAVALAGMRWADERKVTAAKLATFVESTDLASLSGEQRRGFIDDLADRVNRLPFEQRRDLRLDRTLERTFFAMTEAERDRYLDLTLPRGLSQMMEALNNMTTDQRREIVDRALEDLRRAERDRGRTGEDRLGEQAARRIINEGMASYFSDASAETKIDLQPVIEQIQAVMQQRR